ncbi:hypothetical protein Pedsa_2908 [Pseudopedobacter saltans DSM 12145]|uniref:Uncharacterized protein n=1 Tax=Pseudopedobacter saltans (strain ATCC 51119 / DSM 12145 / JCM 21818 / CCUG 39354 / LMG 10337 / NBRC 100064 / NCIMB 13643) TaxID=762903 RepID=F0S8W0_PSESL|nr:hypothetical protein [Pseudopedobacter saltans]ADY53447.1 hypothetical protein Pedsa_2908 [Pseudopedobacter saltans DSM 12145]
MNRILLTLFTFLFICSVSRAQSADDSLYVGLKNGRIIKAKTLELKSPLLAESYLLVNETEKYKTNTVKFYRDLEGYFINASVDNSNERFYKREFKGKISLYSKTYSSYNQSGLGMGGFGGNTGGMMYVGGVTTTNKVEFIQKGDRGGLEKLNYNNLYAAANNNVECVELLRKIKNLRTFSTISYSAGGALILSGIIHTVNLNENSGPPPYPDKKIRFSPLLFAGLGAIVVPSFTIGSKKKKMLKVISIYNQ